MKNPTRINTHISDLFKKKFESNCLKLLIHSYDKISRGHLNEKNENDITLHFVKIMRNEPLSTFYKIDITREYYLDDEESADESARIDIRFMNWSSAEKLEFFIEAKNLSADNWKKSNGVKIICVNQISRYVRTGIDNFILAKYSKGCLLGYIVNGTVANVITKLNEQLTSSKRVAEILSKSTTGKHFYESRHASLTLSHVMLEV